jgi:SAM-dependent methyltransferase
MSPLSNAFLNQAALNQMEPYYPLKAYVCDQCYLVQLPEWESPEAIFSDYVYFSSYSDTWLQHVQRYAESMIQRFSLTSDHQVVEVASNDGYLLQYFQAQGIPVLGIEPARNVAAIAQERGIPTRVAFFSSAMAQALVQEGIQADLLAGNNVLAHVPNLNDFVQGLRVLLKPAGVLTMEFPHLLELMRHNQFDTIYQEHYSYLSFHTVCQVFARHDLHVFDVEQLPTHGGSLRVFAQPAAYQPHRPATERVAALTDLETSLGLNDLAAYTAFQQRVNQVKFDLLTFLIDAKSQGKTLAAYGAPAKGNTLLNYCGIGPELIDYTVDRSPHKQGLYLPGSHLPIYPPEKLLETRPDDVLILPWNLKEEIMAQMAAVRDWGGRFVVPIPRLEIL